VANHQDFAAVGVAVPDNLQVHRVRKMKELGANAWRTAHNPPSVALLDAADHEGMLVWDENHHNGLDTEMEALVLRDRNHPSVIIWSLCNEALCNTDNPAGDAARLNALSKVLDPSMGRLVSANSNALNGPNTPLTLQGFDYSPESYDSWHKLAPHIPAIGSEVSSAVSDRGEYRDDPATGHVAGYDTEAPPWGATAEAAWRAILERPFIAGGFTWTGWDYRGEPTPYAWPDVSSHFGILDLAGFWKDRAFWYHSCWQHQGEQPSHPTLHLLPHWNWDTDICSGLCHKAASATAPAGGAATNKFGQVGSNTIAATHLQVDVWAFTSAEEVDLVHPNGSSLGRHRVKACSHTAWQRVLFVPGKLLARALQAGRVVAEVVVETTGPAKALRLRLEVGATGVVAGGKEVAIVVAEVIDARGRVVPTASNVVTFAVAESSGASIIGTANGDPASLVPNTSPARPAFHGMVLAVVRPGPLPGHAIISVAAPGLAGATKVLTKLSQSPTDTRETPLGASTEKKFGSGSVGTHAVSKQVKAIELHI